MVFEVVENARKRWALEEWAVLVGDESGDHLPAFEHDFFHPQVLGQPPQSNGFDEVFRFLSKGPNGPRAAL